MFICLKVKVYLKVGIELDYKMNLLCKDIC